jgi:hypothetical protein
MYTDGSILAFSTFLRSPVSRIWGMDLGDEERIQSENFFREVSAPIKTEGKRNILPFGSYWNAIGVGFIARYLL